MKKNIRLIVISIGILILAYCARFGVIGQVGDSPSLGLELPK